MQGVRNAEKNISISGFEVEIGGLVPSTCYSVAVAANTGVGQGPTSRPLTAMTLMSGMCINIEISIPFPLSCSKWATPGLSKLD